MEMSWYKSFIISYTYYKHINLKKMTNTLDFKKMENIGGGRAISNFCLAFGSVYAGYAVGAWLNWWNPMGQTAIAAGVIIGAACTVHELYHA
jgi:hypothetical protein